jgi:uncharacterized membrane protein
MDDDLIRWRADRPLRWLILLVGAHSCLLGVLMLGAPRTVLGIFGFPTSVPLFFPSQSGIFLLVLGVCYLRAAAQPSYVFVILLSKALAVPFLVAHAVFLAAPPIIWAAAAGDALMLAAVGLLLYRHHRQRNLPPTWW